MTIVAISNSIVACDSQATVDGIVTSENADKLRLVEMIDTGEENWADSKVALLCGAGIIAEIQAFEKWWVSGCHIEDWPWPDQSGEGSQESTFLIFTGPKSTKDGDDGAGLGLMYSWYPTLGPNPEVGPIDEHEYRTWGSSTEFALGAMASGKSAIEAVQLCIEKSIYCGGHVISCDLSKEFKSPLSVDDIKHHIISTGSSKTATKKANKSKKLLEKK